MDEVDIEGNILFNIVVYNNDIEIVKVVIDWGVDINL